METRTTHGNNRRGQRSTEYAVWATMIQRCTNPKNKDYKYYGKRGVKVCDDWLNSFETFLSDMGTRPENFSLDRINNQHGYSKENCRWVEKSVQNNNRRDNKPITFQGKTLNVGQWEKLLGFTHNTISGRLNHGWDLERAMTTPVRGQPAIASTERK